MKSERFKAAPNTKVEATQMSIGDMNMESSPAKVDTAVIKTYKEGEYPIEVLEKEGIQEEGGLKSAWVRVLIGIRDEALEGVCILILSNNKIYVTNFLKTNRVTYDEELDVGKLMSLSTMVQLHSKQIGTLSGNLSWLLDAVKSPRRLIGKCTYVVMDDTQLGRLKPEDLEYCFHFGKKRWLYYSKALDSWVLLPKGWQKLTNVERFDLDIAYQDTSILEVGETVGCLKTEKCYQWNGENWDEIAIPVNEPGDEYLVQQLFTKEKVSVGTLLYTMTGWIYLN